MIRMSRSGIADRLTPRQRHLHRRGYGRGGGRYGEVFLPRYLVGPWHTNESGEVEARASHARFEENRRANPSRGISFWPHDREGMPGFTRSREWRLPKVVARLAKRNTFYFHAHVQLGLSLLFVTRWKVRYADTWIQSLSRLTGEHPIKIAEKYVAEGREIVRTKGDKPV